MINQIKFPEDESAEIIFRFYSPSVFAAQPQFVHYTTSTTDTAEASEVEAIEPSDAVESVVVEADSSAPTVTGPITLRNIIPIFESDLRTNDILFVKPSDSEASEAAAEAAEGGAVIVPEFRSLGY